MVSLLAIRHKPIFGFGNFFKSKGPTFYSWPFYLCFILLTNLHGYTSRQILSTKEFIYSFYAVTNMQFFIDVVNMLTYGFAADEHLFSDLFIQ
jgi:hypothetical protein